VTDALAVVNAGSSSLKFALFALDGDQLQLRHHALLDGIGSAPHFVAKDDAGAVHGERRWPDADALDAAGALDHLLHWLRDDLADYRLVGAGHRVVHGGIQFSAPMRIDAHQLQALQQLVPLAPLHQPHNLAPIRRLLDEQPQLPQVACFDTAFHRGNPQLARLFALPFELYEQGLQRYGFHGLSYEYIASVLAQHSPAAAAGRCVVLHLGNGASICALQHGRSVASTMGFSALDGLPMGTRCGAIDPGVLIYLMDRKGLDARALERLLYHESGLLGVSGVSGDLRELQASGAPRSRLAIELFAYRIRREIGSLAAALGGLDAIVFTAGIGENSAALRAMVCAELGWLGVELDAAANERGGPCIGSGRCEVWVIPTDEALMIARHTQRVLTGEAAAG
jgi:acetate kinase